MGRLWAHLGEPGVEATVAALAWGSEVGRWLVWKGVRGVHSQETFEDAHMRTGVEDGGFQVEAHPGPILLQTNGVPGPGGPAVHDDPTTQLTPTSDVLVDV